MIKKRGVLVSFFLLFVVISLSLMAEAAAPLAGTDKDRTLPALGWKGDLPTTTTPPCDHGSGTDCSYDGSWLSYLYEGDNVDIIDNDKRVGITIGPTPGDFGESSISRITLKPTGTNNRCYLAFVDRETSGQNNVGGYTAAAGSLIDGNYRDVDSVTNEDFQFALEGYYGAEIIHGLLHGARIKSNVVQNYFCAVDSYWHICQDDSSNIKKNTDGTSNFDDVKYYGALTHANNRVYNCTDYDYTSKTKTDSVTWRELPGDDKDNDGITTEMGDCQDDPVLDPAICAQREDATQCGIKYASCASCINLGVTEVCGDGIDNSCRTGVKDQAALNINDDCDLNVYQTECKVNFDSLPDPKSSVEANLCCGDDGIKDLGTTIKAKSGNYICLNKDLVRTGKGAAPDTIGQSWNTPAPVSSPTGGAISPTGGTTTPTTSAGTWKWVSASGDAKFTIYTIKKPGELTYDVVPSGEDWQQCSVSSEGKMTSLFDQENGDQFYCYASGDQAAWAECCSKEGSCTKDGATEKINGVKVRQAGEGLFNLIPFLNKEKSLIPFGQPGGFFSSEGTTDYEKIYGQNYPSFRGYDYLDVYFDFTGDTVEAGTTLQMEVWSTTGKIVSENILSTVINGATLQTKKVYHAQISVSGWRDITLITFKTTPPAVPLEIKNVQVVKKDTNPVCSGSNTWLNDIDERDQAIEEGKMCKDLGLTWLGNDAVNRCCGDDKGEYGVGSKGGCWNSQGITAGQTTNDVKVELTYGKGEWVYDSDSIPVSATFQQTIFSFPDVLKELNPAYTSCTLTSGTVSCPQFSKDFPGAAGYLPTPYVDKEGKYGAVGLSYVFGYRADAASIEEKTDIKSSLPVKIDEREFTKTNFKEATLTNIKNAKIFFFNPLDDPTSMDEEKTTVKYDELKAEKTVYYIMAKADTLKQTYTYNPSTTETLTYSCTTASCTFPLKGSPPYTVKNVYPAKYDLYFVNVVDGKETRTFINPEKTIYAHDGWLEADNLPQQVIFNGTAFLGCGDTTALGTVAITNEKMCFTQKTTTDGFYCAPEYGWKKDGLSTMIYDKDNKLRPLAPEVLLKPEDRNHTSSIVFGRNTLLNPMLDLTK